MIAEQNMRWITCHIAWYITLGVYGTTLFSLLKDTLQPGTLAPMTNSHLYYAHTFTYTIVVECRRDTEIFREPFWCFSPKMCWDSVRKRFGYTHFISRYIWWKTIERCFHVPAALGPLLVSLSVLSHHFLYVSIIIL